QAKPEGADLPAKVRPEPGPADLAPLHVVQDYRDDRGPPDEKGPDHGRRADDPDDQAGRVERIDDVSPGDERFRRAGGWRRPRRGGHGAPSLIGSVTLP